MRKTLTTAALALTLGCQAWAGIMQTPPAPQPTPDSTTQEPTDGARLDGEIHIPPVASESLTQITLDLLAGLPSLL
jgi:hypothetical protein